jgi:hypothetical protein
MPIPKPEKNENKQKFVQRCMSNDTMKKDYPNNSQRIAVCLGQTTKNKGSILSSVLDILGFSFGEYCEECGSEENLTIANLIIPSEEDYVDFGEDVEEFDVTSIAKTKYEYLDPDTQETFYFDQKRNYKKNNKYLRYVGEAKGSEYQGRKVTLNKPFRTPDGPKKMSVYVKNEKGNVVKVNFGDPNMKIKKNIPERRKSFRARHNCDNPGPKYKARYWSCKAW